jgi:predicted RecB family nuclease
MPNDFPITSDIVAAYSLCQRKAFLLLRSEQCESAHPYVVQKEVQAAASLKTFLELSKRSGLSVQYCIGAQPTGKADVLAQVSLRADDLQAMADALVSLEGPVGKGLSLYEPYLAIGCHSITKADKIRLAFIGHVLGIGHRHSPQTGVIINAAGDTQRIRLTKLIAYLEPVIDTLKAWKDAPATAPPPILLNDHCPICPFKKKCLEQAEKDDSLTLLDRMTPKVMRKYHKKGIFTIAQLSYLYKPRRQRKTRKGRPVGFNLELQALALRTGKIYLHHSPDIPQQSTELFLDMEGVPDQSSTYLIGLVIQCEGKVDSHSLWADSPCDELRIFQAFLVIANRYPSAPIYHYGSYEPKALVRMAKGTGVNVDAIVSRLVNVNKFIYGKVYFPTRSNTLKDLGRVLGATWTDPDASGLQSIIWRTQWQASRDAKLKEQLLRYNIEDCNALALLVSELRKIGQTSTVRSDVDFADTPKRNASPSGQKIHEALEGILKSAHAQYRKTRISLRENRADIQPNRAGN